MLKPGSHNRSFGTQERNGLALHVRAHQCTVGIVVLNKWNQCRSQRSNLVGGNVHIFNFIRLYAQVVTFAGTGENSVAFKHAVFADLGIRLGNYGLVFLLGCKVFNFLTHLAIFIHFTIRGFNKSEIVHFCVNTE